MLLLFEEAGSKIVFLKVSWELDENDYHRFDRELTELISAHGQIRVLVLLDGFRAPDAMTFWQGMGFDLKYPDNVERMAFVGDYNFAGPGMKNGNSKGLEKHNLRFFPLSELDQARHWVTKPETDTQTVSRQVEYVTENAPGGVALNHISRTR